MTDEKRPTPATIFDYLPMGDIDTDSIQEDVKKQFKRKFPKKFFDLATYADSKTEAGYVINLDGRTLKTPLKNTLTLPTMRLASAVCDEWNALGEFINPDHLPLTKTANSAIEKTAPNKLHVVAEMVRFGETDLIFYQQNTPDGLAKLQELHWNPILLWAENLWNVKYKTTFGITHVAQDIKILTQYEADIAVLDEHQLSALYLLTTSCGSLLIALAYKANMLSKDGVAKAAFVDEDWQISQWGEDEEAKQIRQFKLAEIDSFCTYLDLLKN
ncbi:MAG: ATPase [Rhizobiales bacterium]|nr:ATPase [Hyphomicrobiales bacterium]NRB13673.1 ATPase [Hyphomicrobiales bacterium]